MPTFYTHFRIASSIADKVPKEFHPQLYCGANFPDFFTFPGKHRDVAFSESVHYGKWKIFVASLTKYAKQADEKAFVRGVVTHYIADDFLHPYIETLEKSLPVPKKYLFRKEGKGYKASKKVINHVRVEWGLDCYHIQKFPELKRIVPKLPKNISFLEMAFEEALGKKVSEKIIWECYASLRQTMRKCYLVEKVLGQSKDVKQPSWLQGGLKRIGIWFFVWKKDPVPIGVLDCLQFQSTYEKQVLQRLMSLLEKAVKSIPTME